MGSQTTVTPQTEPIRRALERIEGFPALFPVVQKGLQLMDNPNTSNQRLERVLSADVAMVARILKLANSAYFGVMSEVRTLAMAINIIGSVKLRLLLRHILISGLFELMSTGRPGAERIRNTSIGASVASHQIAGETGQAEPDEALIAGLLHNIGDLGLSWAFPQEYESVLSLSKFMPLASAQKSVFGLDSGVFGRWTIEAWRFPSDFAEAVEHWRNPLKVPAGHLRQYLCVVHVGVVLAEGWTQERDPEHVEIWPHIREEIGLSRDTIRKAYAELPGKVSHVQALLEA